MPKMKSHKSSKRRIRLTANGKLVRTQCNVRHLLADRSPKRMRNNTKKATSTSWGLLRRARFALLKGQA